MKPKSNTWDYYDGLAAGYVALHGLEQREKLAQIANLFFPRGLLLDVGAGPCFSAAFFPNSSVIAVDPAEKLLRHYKGFRCAARSEKLPFQDEVFDAVLSVSALHHCTVRPAINEIVRVSKPGAPIALSFFKRGDVGDWMAALERRNFVRHDLGLDWLFIGQKT